MNGIFCVESLWSSDTGSQRTSVAPFLEYIGRSYGVRHTIFDCGTVEELSLRLGKSHKKGYGILYFAGHGRKGKFLLDGGVEVTLEQLAGMMNGHFNGWYIHFASCSVLNVNLKDAKKFKRDTGAARISGYRKDVDWKESGALDLIWLSHLVSGERFDREFFAPLINRLAFITIP